MEDKEKKIIQELQKQAEIQKMIDEAPERTSEQIEISGQAYKPSDGDMVELPDGSRGGINIARPDKEGNYEIELEDGTKVRAPANKLLLRGCWTAYKQRLKEKSN